jgi:hypothetical protein
MWIALCLGLTTTHAEQLPTEETPRECFWSRQMTGWKSGGRDVFAVKVTGGKYYRFEIRGLCPDLRYARTVAFKSRSTRICGDPGDSVRVERQRCYLGNMQRISKQEYLALDDSR